MSITRDQVVSIHYTLKNDAGEVLDRSAGGEPLTYLHGHGNLIPGLERELAGKSAGDKLQVTIAPADAYGEYDPQLVQRVPRRTLKGLADIRVGTRLQAQTEQGARAVTVTQIVGDMVTLDGNHPLAGNTLHFEVEVAEVHPHGRVTPRQPSSSLLELIERAVIFQDKHLLAIDKPAGVAVHGGSGMSFGVIEALRASRPRETLELVHRLDRDTSGCLLVARDRSTLTALHALIRNGGMHKTYLALVAGSWQLGTKRVDAPLATDNRQHGERHVRVAAAGKDSVSIFKPVQFFGPLATLMEVDIPTGRTHQIRVHASFAGHPLLGDDKYGDRERNAELKRHGLKRTFLHAQSVAFEWPGSGVPFHASAPLPGELTAVLDAITPMKRRAPPRQAAPRRAAKPARR